MSDYQLYYNSNLYDSNEYLDWVSDKLRKATPGLIIGPYASRKYQFEHGESFSGIEIKNDKKLAGNDKDIKPSHNLYFEVAEKSHPSNLRYVKSGIYRNDNGWLFLIGNYEEAFLFCTKQLRRMFEDKTNHKERVLKIRKTDTSIGFTLPRIKVINSTYLLNHWVFDEEAIKRHHPDQPITQIKEKDNDIYFDEELIKELTYDRKSSYAC